MKLYNSWVNWVEAEECAYNIPAFFEWDTHDRLMCLSDVPVFKVSSDFFDYVETGLNELPEQLLAETSDGYGESTFVLTDGKNALAVATIGYDVPMLKSRLEIQRETEVLYQAPAMDLQTYDYQPVQQEYSAHMPSPYTMVGLTREERKAKQHLIALLPDLAGAPKETLLYFYTEFCPEQYDASRRLSSSDLYAHLVEGVNCGWGAHHVDLYLALVQHLHPEKEAVENGADPVVLYADELAS